MRVGEDLDLDVARTLDPPLDVERAVAERARGLAPRRGNRLVERVDLGDDAHALAAAAGRRLDDDRQADGQRRGADPGVALIRRRRAGHDRHAGPLHPLARAELRAHRRDRLGRRADEDHAGVAARRGKGRVLGQEAVAGMDRVGARARRGVEDRVDAQVALGRRRPADLDRLVGLADVQGAAIDRRVHRDRRDAALAAGPHHPHGDLAAVGDEQAADGADRGTAPRVVLTARRPISRAACAGRRRARPGRPRTRADRRAPRWSAASRRPAAGRRWRAAAP